MTLEPTSNKMIEIVQMPRNVTLTETSAEFAEDMTRQQWDDFGALKFAEARRLSDELLTVQWQIADWLIFGERKWGETYTQAVEVTHLAKQTLANMAHVASQIPPNERWEGLSFAHHSAVASLNKKDRHDMLAMAKRNELVATELWDEVKDLKARRAGGDPLVGRAKAALTIALDALAKLGPTQQAKVLAESGICKEE
jgi:hypothetical protein